jgi:hypothetical protein
VSSDGPIFLGGAGVPPDPVALKERAASALERALEFVREHGDERTLLRSYVALRAEPVGRFVEAIEAGQRTDGSFPPLSGPSRGWLGRTLTECGVDAALCGTLEGLGLLAEERQDDAPCAEAAVRFVEAAQRPDGSFPADGEDETARIVVTGIAAGSLGRSRYSRPEGLAAAGAWLGERFHPDRVEKGHVAERTAFAMYYSNAPDDRADEALQWCGRELERGFRSHALEALEVLQLLLACQAGSLPGASFAPEELLERLLGEQAADGGFDALSAGGAPARVAPTIDAMRAVIGLCATF